jgi:hypothetical protein
MSYPLDQTRRISKSLLLYSRCVIACGIFLDKKGNPRSWTFDLSTYTTNAIDPSKFAPPSGICAVETAIMCHPVRTQPIYKLASNDS